EEERVDEAVAAGGRLAVGVAVGLVDAAEVAVLLEQHVGTVAVGERVAAARDVARAGAVLVIAVVEAVVALLDALDVAVAAGRDLALLRAERAGQVAVHDAQVALLELAAGVGALVLRVEEAVAAAGRRAVGVAGEAVAAVVAQLLGVRLRVEL